MANISIGTGNSAPGTDGRAADDQTLRPITFFFKSCNVRPPEYGDPALATQPNAKKLILDLLLSAEGRPLSARNAIVSCALFGIRENNVRVALARLSAEGLIEAADRGQYQLSDKAHELADEVATWRSAEQRLRPWAGDYLAVHCGALGRSDRAALRRRDRALAMLGFRELDRGLHLRPNNIEADVVAVRQRLYRIGLEAEAAVFVATGFDKERTAAIAKLWDGKALNRGYRSLREKLEAWVARAGRLDRETAARESFLLGGNAIRAVVFDPLLPEPMVDVAERHAFVEAVRRYDRYGQAIWRALHDSVPEGSGLSGGPASARTRTASARNASGAGS